MLMSVMAHPKMISRESVVILKGGQTGKGLLDVEQDLMGKVD
jgi:hypothetical protein